MILITQTHINSGHKSVWLWLLQSGPSHEELSTLVSHWSDSSPLSLMIKSCPKELRGRLFYLLASWTKINCKCLKGPTILSTVYSEYVVPRHPADGLSCMYYLVYSSQQPDKLRTTVSPFHRWRKWGLCSVCQDSNWEIFTFLPLSLKLTPFLPCLTDTET